ncbi:MAG: ABC transporter permease [Acidobacteriota bacterium]|jgi:predicted permease
MTRLYRLMLRAYPAPMRRAYGRDMSELFDDLLREKRRQRGLLAAALLLLRTFAELPFSAAAARRSASSGTANARGSARTGSSPRSATAAPRDPRNGGRRGHIDGGATGLRQTFRSLRRSPGFAAVVIATLAVGIGANTVMFTVLDGVLLSPLPYENPDRLVRLYTMNDGWEGTNYVPGSGFLVYREQTDIFEGLAAAYSYREVGADLTLGDETQRVVMMPISSGYFEVLGVQPLMGREFRREEENPDAHVAVISYGLWQSAFGGADDVLGREIEVEGVPLTVIGVMPAGFRNPIDWQVDLWRPENLTPGGRNNWGNYYLSAVGRLRDDVTLTQAQDALRALGAAMFEENPDTYGTWAAILPLLEDTVGDTQQMLWVLMAAVGMVLLIACVNVASLYLVRAAERGKELAIRAALGAGRGRLFGQMLGESLLLGVAGGLAGLLLSFIGLRAVIALSPDTLPRVAELGIDGQVFAFTTAVSLLTGLLFGAVPALRSSRPDLERTLREEGRASSAGTGQRRLRAALVVAEISLALVLLFGAGLLVKSFNHLLDVDLGVRRNGILTYEVHLPTSRYPEAQDRVAFYDRYFERVRSIPGVEEVGATSYLPTEGRYHIWSLGRADLDLEDDDSWTSSDVRVVDGDYFDIMGIELVRGRLFSESDSLDAPWPAVINQSLAAAAFPDRDPIGVDVKFGGDDFRVVGIVTDTAYDARGTTSSKVYAGHDQFAGDRNWAMIQTVSTSVEPSAIVGQLRAELRDIDPQLVLYRVRTFADVVATGISPQRFAMALMTGFAAVALLLAAIGIYGVLSYAVAQRTHEIGIRMALGADRGAVRSMVLRQGLLLTGLGLSFGVAGALALTGWLSSLLFEVEPGDPMVLLGVGATLALVAGLAGYLPARRATAVDPMQALRME